MTENLNDLARKLGLTISENCSCEELRAHLYELIDQELDPQAISRLDAHEASCEQCHQLTEAEVHLRQIIRRSCCEEAPAVLRERVITQVVRRYRKSN